MKVAFSHDWLNGMRGGEKCLEAFSELYPDGDIHTLFCEKDRVSERLAGRRIRTSFIQNLPNAFRHYRYYLPFFPRAVEGFRLKGYDLVISTSHCVAKGIRKNPGAFHLCYCFTPMRYAWGFFDEYFGGRSAAVRLAARFWVPRLRAWDVRANAGVDRFVAISNHVRQRIRRFYGRDAGVIYPPVDTGFFTPDPAVKRGSFYLVVSALVPYKRVDLAVEAFKGIDGELVVIGEGPERTRLEKGAPRNVHFLGWLPDPDLRDYYRRARALVFPGEEDFGIVPVEFQACGGAVIAFGKGGVLETVLEGKTGVFFHEASVEGLADAVRRFEAGSWDPAEARRQALRFNRERFKTQMRELIERECRPR